jgi:metal-responsive CopG/Arc/MetJ family transcriptional regulator
MKTVQMTLDDELVEAVDKAARKLRTTRSAFTRKALRAALEVLAIEEKERKHRLGYTVKPVQKGEFDIDEDDRAWGTP